MNEANGQRVRVHRVAKAYLVTVLVAASEIALVRYVLLPMVARSLTPEQRNWLHEAFSTHLALVLLAIVVFVMLLGVPVLLVGLRMLRRV